jgi:hypothetical protein
VVARLLNDYRNHEWGKWHDSREATRLGQLAVELERLTIRDGRSLDEALLLLGPKYPGTTRAALEALAGRFPQRQRRRTVSLDDAGERTANHDPGEAVANSEVASCISRVVNAFVRDLPEDDQLLLQLRFASEMPVPQIAQVLHQDTQALYRRLRAHTGMLRGALEAAGIRAADVAKLIGSDGAILDFRLKSKDRRPSNDEEPGTPEEEA